MLQTLIGWRTFTWELLCKSLSVLTQGLPNVTVVCQYCTREPSFHTFVRHEMVGTLTRAGRTPYTFASTVLYSAPVLLSREETFHSNSGSRYAVGNYEGAIKLWLLWTGWGFFPLCTATLKWAVVNQCSNNVTFLKKCHGRNIVDCFYCFKGNNCRVSMSESFCHLIWLLFLLFIRDCNT